MKEMTRILIVLTLGMLFASFYPTSAIAWQGGGYVDCDYNMDCSTSEEGYVTNRDSGDHYAVIPNSVRENRRRVAQEEFGDGVGVACGMILMLAIGRIAWMKGGK